MATNFQIWNITGGYKAKFLVDDADRDGALSYGDTIRIVDGYVSPTNYYFTYKMTWARGVGVNLTPPKDGDRFLIRTARPFAQGDYFEFKTRAAGTDPVLAKSELSRIGVVPNPYIATTAWERRSIYNTGRGDRQISFTHLPARCTVRIFTISGQLVKSLEKNSGAADGSLTWDLVSDDGMDIAYGLYIFHVNAPGVGEHIGKFAVVK
jgi:hypothetical protein